MPSIYNMRVSTVKARDQPGGLGKAQHSSTIVKCHFSAQEVEFWGKFHRLGGGDTMRAAAICHASAEDRRDVSYVRVGTIQSLFFVSCLLTQP